MTADMIIPTYKPGQRFLDLMEMLKKQSFPIHRIYVFNTEKRYFEELISEKEFCEKYRNAQLRHISKEAFDHGGTRNEAAALSDADVFLCMTQDALPADERLVERLMERLQKEEKVAVTYARQLPEEGCGPLERFTRQFNYPETPAVKSEADLERLGIKTYFCSNVCAAYRREIFEGLGGFVKHTIFNEDMIFAAKAVKAGYLIAYEPAAEVYHSHSYTCREQFHRNFDLGVSQAQHPEVFETVASESEGLRFVKDAAAYTFRIRKPWLAVGLVLQSAFKYAGFRLGKRYKTLPDALVRRCSMNKEYWKTNCE